MKIMSINAGSSSLKFSLFNMENEEVKNEALKEEEGLLKAYKELEKNSVPKDKYEKEINELKEKNKLYLDAITNGKNVELDKKEDVSIEDRIKQLSKFKGTNLEYWEEMTSAIDSIIKKMPEAEIVKVTGTDGLEELIKVNQGMKQMVSDANGDPDYFRTLYNQRVRDDAPRISAEIEKAGGLYNYLASNQNKK